MSETRDELWMYRRMLLSRRFEERLIELNNTGTPLRIGHPYIGQEAVAVGVAASLTDGDRLLSNHRSHGHAVAAGVPLSDLAAELLERTSGPCRGRAGEMSIACPRFGLVGSSEIVGGSIAFGLGFALESQLMNHPTVTVTFFGDGAANQGSLYEAMNLAAIWNLPIIFFCENNGYAESTPVEYAVAGGSISARAAGYGIPMEIVDGHDVLAVRDAVTRWVEHSRSGKGPVFVEATTYRYHGHFYGDQHLRYRSRAELDERMARDCISRLRTHLLERGAATAAELDALEQAVLGEIESAIAEALEGPEPVLLDLLEGLYADALDDTPLERSPV